MDVITCVRGATLKMKSVKAALDASPAGPQKNAASEHYRIAETAHLAKCEADCNNALDAARRVLG